MVATLPEDFRQHAWHCLLEMADPLSSPAPWSYGIDEVSRQNIQAISMFEEMDESERGLMMVELLRVVGLLLKEVADAISAGAGYRTDRPSTAAGPRDDMVDVPYEEEDEEGVAMVQTEAKRAKLGSRGAESRFPALVATEGQAVVVDDGTDEDSALVDADEEKLATVAEDRHERDGETTGTLKP